jgi:Ca-activated chloride channel homolog
MHTTRTTRVLTRGVSLLLATATWSSVSATHADEATQADDPEDGKLELVLDSSGSMAEPAGGGQTKIAAAKQALGNVVDSLPDDANVGLRVYGATVFSASNPKACRDTQQVVPIGPVDKPALREAIASYQPYGETPIAYSLRQAAEDLGDEGQRTIVLVSDGLETCHPDPCALARRIAGRGIDLKIDVVGFHVDRSARQQLRCIAEAGHGTYYDADDATDLEASLGKLSTRAFRPFEVTGEPVEGSTSPDSAPSITPGQYVTTVDAANGEPEYVAVEKTPGSSLWVSLTARPPHSEDERQDLALLLSDPSRRCETKGVNYTLPSGVERWQPVFVASTMIDTRIPKTAACAEADRVLVGFAGRGATGPGGGWDAELQIIEEPPVGDGGGLPAADTSTELSDRSTWRGSGDATRVTGGVSFSDAPTLGEGVYTDTIVPGERLLYRVPVEYGQRVTADLYFPHTDPATSKALNTYPTGDVKGLGVAGQLYGPGRVSLTQGDSLLIQRRVQGARDVALALRSPEVRYLNRTEPRLRGASIGGDYFVEVDAAVDDNHQTYTIPFQLNVTVEGEPAGEPSYEEIETATEMSSPGPEPEYPDEGSASDDSDGGTSWVLVAAIGGGAAALVVAVLVATRLARQRH